MKHLIIYGNPSGGNLNHYFKITVEQILKQNRDEVVVRDLYELGFNPILSSEDIAGQQNGMVANDVKQEQDFVSWADYITFIHPIWWTGQPAMIKGYIERVFSYGFAYHYYHGAYEGLLGGKGIFIINTLGKSENKYRTLEIDKALSLTSGKDIYYNFGLEIQRHLFFIKQDENFENLDNWTKEIIKSYSICDK